MLQKQTTPTATFRLLEQIMKDSFFNDFHLAGGTAIALYLGHRESIDLDLFTPKPFDVNKTENYLYKEYNFATSFSHTNTLKGTISGVKFDMITFNYPFCEQIQHIDNVRLYSLEDIVPMKLLAIADNGTRPKDFIDIAFLSTRYSLEEMLQFTQHKFPAKNPLVFEKALLYHNDIHFDEPIRIIDGVFDWDKIKNRLENMVDNPHKVFTNTPLQNEPKRRLRR